MYNVYTIGIIAIRIKRGGGFMQTTTLHVDMIIIGAEGLAWIITLFAMLENKVIIFLKASLSGTSVFAFATVIFLCVCYVLGIIIDRIGYFAFRKRKNEMMNSYGFESSAEVYKTWQEKEALGLSYYDFIMSRGRIMSGTILNLIPITLTFTAFAILHSFSYVSIAFIAILGVLAFCVCIKLKVKMDNDYYIRVSTFKELQAKEKNNVKNKK